MRRAVFLDRDGVINKPFVKDGKSYPPSSLEEFELLPGVVQAINNLKSAGYAVVVVTNQPDVATGKQKLEVVESFHRQLSQQVDIDLIKVCYHTDGDDCSCRKPRPGMLLEAAEELGIDLGKSFLVGDRWRDIESGQRAGCGTFFIDYGYAERRPEPPYTAVESLAQASRAILETKAESS
ncbi:MAG: HAD family hydrolase [Desulfarculaceae bacterium]|nr:HAD family hydrolase [Desulfarculaceae bacterium]MCF8072939.1 HAD family hydrolase [Desulfarculaceae bacterium]MCF8101107.1 HAD family hydrolase [Desulfarculaceae bacterium]MCF8115506.1 HAD family hydrolase [Desulfarculaceae bacterium]